MLSLNVAMRSAAEGLRYAAAPSFAAMALLSGMRDNTPDMLCGQHASLLTGMVPMYLLMGLFHLAPWLRLLAVAAVSRAAAASYSSTFFGNSADKWSMKTRTEGRSPRR
jgi:hypothetical protein